MSQTLGIGHSAVTPDKQDGFGALVRLHLEIASSVWRKHKSWAHPTYIYVDTNAGSGRNPQEDCDGSPVIFLKEAGGHGMEYFAHLIDWEPGNTEALKAATARYANRRSIHTADNRERLPQILSGYPKDRTFGLIYSDPNGVPDFGMLADAARRQSKMDILIRCPANAVKRMSESKGTGVKLTDLMLSVGKGEWIIREPIPSDKWQWTFLFATNFLDFPGWAKHRFHRLDTEDGSRILQRLNLTRDEIAHFRQSPLFNTPRNLALSRSGGTCERCHQNSVTEVHHFRYPALTENDVIAVCHICHCAYTGRYN